MVLSRRKPRVYRSRVETPKKSERRELTAVERAFCCGAVIGGAGLKDVLELLPPNTITKSGLSKLIKRVKRKAEEASLPISDPYLYGTEVGRGRKHLLTEEQKRGIIAIATSCRNNREKESWQAIQDNDFKAITPRIIISLFENIMYEAGYSRRKPGWKPKLTPDQEQHRYKWALIHNPDKHRLNDNKGFNFRRICFTDETPARVGEQRGMMRSWQKDGEWYDDDVKKDRVQKYSQLQFYGAFTYHHKGPCVIYERESELEKTLNTMLLEAENEDRRTKASMQQTYARSALNDMSEADVNGRYNTTKQQYTKADDYTRGFKSRGGVDGLRHRDEALKKVVPWMKNLATTTPILLEDGAPAHIGRIANDYLHTEQVAKLSWPGHSPEVNASEHAWPWIRRHITKNYPLSGTIDQCKQHWREQWEALPQEVIDKWIDGIPDVVRKLIEYGGKNNFHDGGGWKRAATPP
jgi:hypothetical protein